MFTRLAAASAAFMSLAVLSSGLAFAETDKSDAEPEKVDFVTSLREVKPNEKVEKAAKKAEKELKEETATKAEKELKEETRVSGYAANPYGSLISSYAERLGVAEALAHAVVQVESNYKADATGAAGEIGLMQLKLSTARMMGYTGSAKNLYDPETNIRYGMKYLAKAQELGDGSTCGTILKYNAGHGARSMNPISARYCSKVTALLE